MEPITTLEQLKAFSKAVHAETLKVREEHNSLASMTFLVRKHHVEHAEDAVMAEAKVRVNRRRLDELLHAYQIAIELSDAEYAELNELLKREAA